MVILMFAICLTQLVWKFPLGRLSSSPPPPPPLTVALLELLLVCATSTVTSLTPPLPKTLLIFKAHCTHPSIEVREGGKERGRKREREKRGEGGKEGGRKGGREERREGGKKEEEWERGMEEGGKKRRGR